MRSQISIGQFNITRKMQRSVKNLFTFGSMYYFTPLFIDCITYILVGKQLLQDTDEQTSTVSFDCSEPKFKRSLMLSRTKTI